MNDRRSNMVKKAFKILDRTGDGTITFEDIKNVYDVSHNPEFLEGKKTKE